MQSPGDLELTRRGLLIAGAASAVVTAASTMTKAQPQVSGTGAPVMSKVSFTINGKLSDLAGETARVRGCRIEPLDETRTLQIDLRRHDRGRVGRTPIGAGRQRFASGFAG